MNQRCNHEFFFSFFLLKSCSSELFVSAVQQVSESPEGHHQNKSRFVGYVEGALNEFKMLLFTHSFFVSSS
jgi:hypothetical protein